MAEIRNRFNGSVIIKGRQSTKQLAEKNKANLSGQNWAIKGYLKCTK